MSRRHNALSLIALAALVATGCAHRPRQEVAFDPVVITGDPALEKLNDEELLAEGTAKAAANEHAEAIRYFDRLAVMFPHSPHRQTAFYRSGVAHAQLQRWEEAYQRFDQIADPKGAGDALDAAFRAAEALYHLDRFADAAALLRKITAREDLTVGRRLEAQVQLGVCEVELGALDEAERTLRAAVDRYEALGDRSEVNDYFPAQAQFFLGEIYRLNYAKVVLDGARGVDQLAEDLELKSKLLLSAQGHYLRTIRLGNGYWATAAGSRIGALYEDLYDHMLASRPPPELAEEEADVYRDELKKRVRVLITKAIVVYEQTLEAAERIGTSGPFIEKTRESLQKMKDRLVADAESTESSAAVAPSSAPLG